MKTMNKVLLLSAVAFGMAVVSSAKADGALLSPRAQGNQIRTVAGTNDGVRVAQPAQQIALLSPRNQGNQIHKVAGTHNDPDLVAAMQALPGSPKTKMQLQLDVYQIAPVK